MDLFARAKSILFAPGAEWPVIAGEKTSAASLAVYVAVLAAIPALARFAGESLVGASTPEGAVARVPVIAGLLGAVADYGVAFIAVGVVALVINALAPWFGARRSWRHAFALTAYSFTPYWLAGIFMLVPGLRFLGAFGLYGFYLVWTGLPRVMRSPPGASLGYAAAVGASALIVALFAIKLATILTLYARSM